MASPTDKNPSFSLPIPNRPNPKPRNSEAGDPLRRSFGGNPFPAKTKVNIPLDCSRRNSFGGDKENVTKAVPKGSKNFMSPTISAVSKINPSPRKRVLSDKNEMSRSFSDVKGLILDKSKSHHQPTTKSCVSFSDVLHTICIDEKKKFGESYDMTVTDFDENEVYDNRGITYSDPRFRISPRPSVRYTSPEFAACEVDSSLPPYDPKKNYLSPRPQFLHYNPNPRMEKGFDECKKLEALFISESSSTDTGFCIEETEKSEEQEENSAEAVVEDTDDVEQLEEESDEVMVCESIKETSQVPKQSGFRKFKYLGWFFALVLGYMLVSSVLSPPTESPFYDFHISKEIRELAKSNNLEKLSGKVWTLTESSLVYIDKLITRLGGGEVKYGPLQFDNLTYTLQDNTVFKPIGVEINGEPEQEKSRVEYNLQVEDGYVNEFGENSGAEEVLFEDGDDNAEAKEFDEYADMKQGTGIEWNDGEGNLTVLLEDGYGDAEANDFDAQAEMKPRTDIEGNDVKGNLKTFFKDGVELNIEKEKDTELNLKENDNARGTESEEQIETESTKKDQEVSEGININQHDVESATNNEHQENADTGSGPEEAFGEVAAETSYDLGSKVRSINDSTKEMIVLSSTAILVLLLVITFVFTKKPTPVAATVPEPILDTTEELNLSHEPVENLMKEKLFSLNFEGEVDDRTSNSFHKKSSLHQRGVCKKSNSSKLRRESMASSASEYSVDSFSYGSFTTYEKIPIKTGDREEEMITPVRRSSRIRNKT